MVRNFRGQVRIEDVQNEFDSLVTDINSLVDEYNSADKVKDIDYSKGGKNLGNSGYCLTVGGLKQFLSIMNGTVYGCRPFKDTDNSIITTSGVYISEKGIEQIPKYRLEGKGSSLYYNYDDKILEYGQDGEPVYSEFTIPQYTSSNTWGNMICNYQSSEAYKARRDDSQYFWITALYGQKISENTAKTKYPITWTWNLGNTLKAESNKLTLTLYFQPATQMSLDAWKQMISMGLLWVNCAVQANGKNLTGTYSIKTSGTVDFNFTIPNGLEINTIKIYPQCSGLVNMDSTDRAWSKVGIKNVKITGTTKTAQYYTDGGGRGIKICDLNWNRDNTLTIDSINNVKFSNE